jgi:hypothetical protein
MSYRAAKDCAACTRNVIAVTPAFARRGDPGRPYSPGGGVGFQPRGRPAIRMACHADISAHGHAKQSSHEAALPDHPPEIVSNRFL